MGYQLRAFIGKVPDIVRFAEMNPYVHVALLNRDLALVPMTHELFDEINQGMSSDDIGTLQFMTPYMESVILNALPDSQLAYVEADYFGSVGFQEGIVWNEGRRKIHYERGQSVINEVLSHFGISGDGKKDAFDVVGLAKHRETGDWLTD